MNLFRGLYWKLVAGIKGDRYIDYLENLLETEKNRMFPKKSLMSLPRIEIYDIETNNELSKLIDYTRFDGFVDKIRANPFSDGQIVYFCGYYKIHRVIRDFDHNKIRIYWEFLEDYTPTVEYKEGLLTK